MSAVWVPQSGGPNRSWPLFPNGGVAGMLAPYRWPSPVPQTLPFPPPITQGVANAVSKDQGKKKRIERSRRFTWKSHVGPGWWPIHRSQVCTLTTLVRRSRHVHGTSAVYSVHALGVLESWLESVAPLASGVLEATHRVLWGILSSVCGGATR